MHWALFASTSFACALLLFVVQPMLGRMLLPWLGGSPATWTTCMLFFQSGLLLGYLLSHLLSRLLSPRGALLVLGGLCLAAGSLLPLSPAPPGAGTLAQAPISGVLWLLATSAGLPYLLLAASTPLLQRGFSSAGGKAPYGLYAISNAGSLLGLVLYPLAAEPLLTLLGQAHAWALGYALFALGLLACGLRAAGGTPDAPGAVRTAQADKQALGRRLQWCWLSFVPSLLMLAVTQHITTDVAAVPLLWVLPLGTYLASFIMGFGWPRRCQGSWLDGLWLLGGGAALWLLFQRGSAQAVVQLAILCPALLLCGLMCHGRLARLAPPVPQLTTFYLWVATGGLAGGIFAGLLAPLVLPAQVELELALGFTLVVWLMGRRRRGPMGQRLVLLAFGLALPLLGLSLWSQLTPGGHDGKLVARHRDFHGVLRVSDQHDQRLLTHGNIGHGMAWLDGARTSEPTFYFGRSSGLGLAMARHNSQDRKIGLVGLGAGTVAAHTRPTDRLRAYELNPTIVELAKGSFPFLKPLGARASFVLGDGRLSLEREPAQGFDVLVVDVYSSNAIPVHLFTREAMQVYQGHLAPDGLLLFNISNRHVRLDRVLLGHARHFGLALRMLETPADSDKGLVRVRWALLAADGRILDRVLRGARAELAQGPAVDWTDQRSSLLGIIR